MSGDSGMQSTLDNYNVDNDNLDKMQNHMRVQSLNTLNREMVRSSAYFGFGERPEPQDFKDSDFTLDDNKKDNPLEDTYNTIIKGS